MAGMLANSLRRNGFTGRIACIAGGDVDGCERCDIPELAGSTPSTSSGQAGSPQADFAAGKSVFLRTHGEQLIPGFFEHDYILYLDADVLAIAPLTPILDNPDVRSIVSAQCYFRPRSSCAYNFTNWDIEQPGKRWGVCAGIVGFPGDQAGRDFYRLWHFESAGRRLQDETALNVVLHRSAAIWGTKWEYMPAVRMSSAEDRGECLVHYLQDPFGHAARGLNC